MAVLARELPSASPPRATLRAMRRELRSKQDHAIRAMFGRIAHRYDLLNRVLSLGRDVAWRRHLVRCVTGCAPNTVLDVCTGTGDIALAMTETSVVGADFCLPMLALARRKAGDDERQLPLVAADALGLPVADASVEVVTVAFGVRNFSDLDAGLRELVRVLRPHGRLVVLEFSRPRGVLAPLLGWWVRSVPPLIGRLVSGDAEAYSYLTDSVDRFPSGDAMCERLAEAGLEKVTSRALTGGVATLYQGVRPVPSRASGKEASDVGA